MPRLFSLLLFILLPAVSALALENGSFENSEATATTSPPYWPTEYGDWGGNSSFIVGASHGIVPYDGSSMLQFIATGPVEPGGGTGSSVFQLLNVEELYPLIARERVRFSATASFNRIHDTTPEDRGQLTDSEFNLGLFSHLGGPASFPVAPFGTESFALTMLETDSNTSTWETIETSLVLPANTGYIAILIQANENISNESMSLEFGGHFCDNVAITIQVFPHGDFDYDFDVDGRDFLFWQRGGSPDPFSAADLTDWQANYGTNTLTAAVAAVPEPSTALLALGLVAVFSRQRTPC